MCLVLSLSIAAWGAAAWGAEKEKRFRVEPASTYPNKQSGAGLTIAAVPYTSAEQARTAFGKVNPYEFGVLPILVVMQNDTGKTLRLSEMEVNLVDPDNRKVDATPPGDVQYLEGPKRPNFGGSPVPNPFPRKKKSKLATPEIEGLGFHAKMLPAGEAAHGFLYFQAGMRKGSILYIRGIVEAPTGKELLFYEIRLE